MRRRMDRCRGVVLGGRGIPSGVLSLPLELFRLSFVKVINHLVRSVISDR